MQGAKRRPEKWPKLVSGDQSDCGLVQEWFRLINMESGAARFATENTFSARGIVDLVRAW